MKRILRYLSGYVRVELTGYATERFLNLCTNHNIYIWDMEHREDAYEFSMSISDFFSIRPLVKKTKTRVRIQKKMGFPVFLFRYRKRKLFLAGFFLGVGIIYLFSCYIWNVEICGNSVLSEETLFRYLETEKVYVGSKKKDINCEELEAEIRQHFPNVIWTSVRLEGTKLTVDIKENLVTAEEDKKTEAMPQDIVADKTGVIQSIITRSGVPQVKAGDKVKEGKILVLGRIEIRDDIGEVKEYKYCKADADIIAKTTYSYEYRVPKQTEQKVFTGKEKQRYGFWYKKKYVEFPSVGKTYRLYEKETEKKQLKIMKNFYLPFYLQKDTYREYEKKTHEVSKEEAKQIALANMEVFLSKLEEKGVQIIEKNVIMDTEKNEYVLKGTITANEKFGIYQDTKQLEVPKEEGNIENESE